MNEIRDGENKVVSQGAFNALQSELEAMRKRATEAEDLSMRALSIIADAIMHGMPIDEEVADVRNKIIKSHQRAVLHRNMEPVVNAIDAAVKRRNETKL